MRFLRENIVFRYFWVLMAIHILNCSIDTPDALPNHIAEDLSYNDIETFSELVLEQFLGIENAIPEHDEQDNADGLSFEISKILLYTQAFPCFNTTETPPSKELTLLPIYKNWMMNHFHPDQVTPPPKV